MPGVHVLRARRQHRGVADGRAEVQAVEVELRRLVAAGGACGQVPAVVPRLHGVGRRQVRIVQEDLQHPRAVPCRRQVRIQYHLPVRRTVGRRVPVGQYGAVAGAPQYTVADPGRAGIGQADGAVGKHGDGAPVAILQAVPVGIRAGQPVLDGGEAQDRVFGTLQQGALERVGVFERGGAHPAGEDHADHAEDHQHHGHFDQRETALAAGVACLHV